MNMGTSGPVHEVIEEEKASTGDKDDNSMENLEIG